MEVLSPGDHVAEIWVPPGAVKSDKRRRATRAPADQFNTLGPVSFLFFFLFHRFFLWHLHLLVQSQLLERVAHLPSRFFSGYLAIAIVLAVAERWGSWNWILRQTIEDGLQL